MTTCVGQFGGGNGSWYAELRPGGKCADLYERGNLHCLGRVYIDGAYFPMNADGDVELDPRTPQAQRLMWVVNAKAAHETLAEIVRVCQKASSEIFHDTDMDVVHDVLSEIRRDANECLDRARVPQPEEPANVGAMKEADDE